MPVQRYQNIGASGFRGATKSQTKFMSQIKDGNKKYYLGNFPTAEKAAEAYLEAETRLFGNTFICRCGREWLVKKKVAPFVQEKNNRDWKCPHCDPMSFNIEAQVSHLLAFIIVSVDLFYVNLILIQFSRLVIRKKERKAEQNAEVKRQFETDKKRKKKIHHSDVDSDYSGGDSDYSDVDSDSDGKRRRSTNLGRVDREFSETGGEVEKEKEKEEPDGPPQPLPTETNTTTTGRATSGTSKSNSNRKKTATQFPTSKAKAPFISEEPDLKKKKKKKVEKAKNKVGIAKETLESGNDKTNTQLRMEILALQESADKASAQHRLEMVALRETADKENAKLEAIIHSLESKDVIDVDAVEESGNGNSNGKSSSKKRKRPAVVSSLALAADVVKVKREKIEEKQHEYDELELDKQDESRDYSLFIDKLQTIIEELKAENARLSSENE